MPPIFDYENAQYYDLTITAICSGTMVVVLISICCIMKKIKASYARMEDEIFKHEIAEDEIIKKNRIEFDNSIKYQKSHSPIEALRDANLIDIEEDNIIRSNNRLYKSNSPVPVFFHRDRFG